MVQELYFLLSLIILFSVIFCLYLIVTGEEAGRKQGRGVMICQKRLQPFGCEGPLGFSFSSSVRLNHFLSKLKTTRVDIK